MSLGSAKSLPAGEGGGKGKRAGFVGVGADYNPHPHTHTIHKNEKYTCSWTLYDTVDIQNTDCLHFLLKGRKEGAGGGTPWHPLF